MAVRTSQYNPAAQVPEKSWAYRFAKRFWFSDFGTYKGMDHSKESAPAVLAKRTSEPEAQAREGAATLACASGSEVPPPA